MSVSCILQEQGSQMHVTVLTLPAGRISGDMDGDGLVTKKDAETIQYDTGSAGVRYNNLILFDIFPDGNFPLDYQIADVNSDGAINSSDINACYHWTALQYGIPSISRDVLNNWIVEKQSSLPGQNFYVDLDVKGAFIQG